MVNFCQVKMRQNYNIFEARNFIFKYLTTGYLLLTTSN